MDRWARAKVFKYNKTSVGRAIAFGCATRCHLSVHSLAMPRSGLDVVVKGGPEPLEKELHKIFGSKREDRFSDPFLKLVQIISGSFFRTCFITVIYVRTRKHCESSRRSARR